MKYLLIFALLFSIVACDGPNTGHWDKNGKWHGPSGRDDKDWDIIASVMALIGVFSLLFRKELIQAFKKLKPIYAVLLITLFIGCNSGIPTAPPNVDNSMKIEQNGFVEVQLESPNEKCLFIMFRINAYGDSTVIKTWSGKVWGHKELKYELYPGYYKASAKFDSETIELIFERL